MKKCMLSMMAFYLHYLKNMIELNYILLRYRWWIQLQLSSNLRFLTNLSPGPNRRMCAFSTDHSEDSWRDIQLNCDSIVITAINKLDKMLPAHCLCGFERLTRFLHTWLNYDFHYGRNEVAKRKTLWWLRLIRMALDTLQVWHLNGTLWKALHCTVI